MTEELKTECYKAFCLWKYGHSTKELSQAYYKAFMTLDLTEKVMHMAQVMLGVYEYYSINIAKDERNGLIYTYNGKQIRIN